MVQCFIVPEFLISYPLNQSEEIIGMANERVLVINNSIEERRHVTEQILIPNGYEVRVAADRDGLKTALADPPDVILLDWTAPEMVDLQPLAMMQEQGLTIPVILLVAQEAEGIPISLLRQGVKDYVIRPIDTDDLLAALERALVDVRLCQDQANLNQRLMASQEQVEQHLKELNTLFGVGKSITATFNQEQVFARLVEAAIYLTDAEESVLLLIDESRQTLYAAEARGMDEWKTRSLRLNVADSLAGQVVTQGQSFIFNQAQLQERQPDYPAQALMYVPLRLREEIKGVLGVSHRHQARQFTNHDLRLLSALSDYAAVFVDNADLVTLAKNNQTMLTTLLNEVEQPVAVLDDADRMILSNTTFRYLFDLGAAALDPCPVNELLSHQPLLDFISATPEAGHQSELFLDDERIFSATLLPVPGVGRGLVMQDITHFKTLNQIKSDFITAAADKMQTPLVSTREYAEMLQTAGGLSEKQEMFFDRVITGLDKSIQLINHLLDLSTVENGTDLNLTVFDLSQITAEVVAEFQNQARQKRQQLIYHAPAQPAFIVGSPLRLRQVIGHLLDNAINYTPPDGRISTIIQIEAEQVLVKIEDNGQGIPHVDLPFIFDKFFQVRSKEQADQQGMGLGLAICKSVIEKYGGSIWVESVYDQGSTFFFSLPSASSAVNQSNEPDNAAAIASAL